MSEQEVQTVDGAVPRAFAVLEFLAQEIEPQRLSAIALRLGFQKSTVHRILSTLVDLGFAEQVESTGCYQASLRMWELGTGLIAQHPVKQAANNFLHHLHQTTGETVSLTILSGVEVLFIDKILTPRPIRFTSRVGSRAPAPLTAGGKAMLAFEPNAQELVQRARLIVDKDRQFDTRKLMAELKRVRKDGYSTASYLSGIASFGAPVMARGGKAAAAISVSVPSTRITPLKQDDIIEQLLMTTSEIAEKVGHF